MSLFFMVVCYPVNQPVNGFAEFNCMNPVLGQDCMIGCNSGFSLQPNTPRIQCTSNGWNPTVIPICQQLNCPELISRDNRLILDNQCRFGSPGTRCQFSCPTGYSLSPNINYLECNSNGQWSGQLPICVSSK